MKLHSVSRTEAAAAPRCAGSRTLADGLDSAVYTILSQYSRRRCRRRRRRLLLASLVAMVYTVWWLLLIPTVVVDMYYWVYRRRTAHWRDNRCTTNEATAAVAGAAGNGARLSPLLPSFVFVSGQPGE